MRWRVPVGILGLVIVVVCAFEALSTASPDDATLPPPVAIATSAPSPSPTSAVAPVASEPATPRGNPTNVRVSRRGVTILSKPISGAVDYSVQGSKRVLEPPASNTMVGWFQHNGVWPRPGFVGPSTLVGHISFRGDPGPFYKLRFVRPGDTVVVSYSSGDRATFMVTAVDKPPKLDLPVKKIWNTTSVPELRLITCDPNTPFVDGHYLGNIVVYADDMVSITSGSGGK